MLAEQIVLNHIRLLLRASIVYAPSYLLELLNSGVYKVVFVSFHSFDVAIKYVSNSCWSSHGPLESLPRTPIWMALKDLLEVRLSLLPSLRQGKASNPAGLIINRNPCLTFPLDRD